MRTNKSSTSGKMAFGRGALILGVLILLAGQAAAQGGPIVLDGVGDDWDPAWQVATDPLDVFITETGLHPHESPTYARSGYDATGLWAHYQAADGRWYFRIDVDGRAGDSDSQTGTPGNLGVGTHGPDQGPLVQPPYLDGEGLSLSEGYILGIQYESGGVGSTALLGNTDPGLLPGAVAPTTGLAGLGVYGTAFTPGVIEFAFDRGILFPAGEAYWELWVSAQLGDFEDRVSDDQVAGTLVMALDLVANCPEAPIVSGDEATFPLDYAIPSSAMQGPTAVVLTVLVPAGTSFVSASDGGTESGGVITWQLGDLAPGDAGQVTFTLLMDDPPDPLNITSEISCAEGLRYRATVECPVQPPPPPPPTPPTPTPPPPDVPVVPEPTTVTLVLTGLGGLAGYAAMQWRARRRR